MMKILLTYKLILFPQLLKCFVKDENGNVVKEEIKKKDRTTSIVPKLLRDDKGKIVYEEVNGKFLNCDQFWKDKGSKLSFHQMQNDLISLLLKKDLISIVEMLVLIKKINQNQIMILPRKKSNQKN